jgi:hypothetical protein
MVLRSFFCCLLLLSPLTMVHGQTIQSDLFADSVGINIHLHYTQTPYYTNFPMIRDSLVELGVRHERDGFIDNAEQLYYDHHNELGRLGIKGMFTTLASQDYPILQSWPLRVSDSFEAYENPNELDRVAGGLDTLESTMPRLFSVSLAGTAPYFPVIGASLTKSPSYAQLGDTSAYIDFGNLHNYFGGRNPGTAGWGGLDANGNAYGGLAYQLDFVRITSGSKPIYSTETGYSNTPLITNWVSQEVAAMYMPRLLFEHWNAGIRRTYLYELLSNGTGSTSDWGLLASDGTKKPAYYAVANLVSLLGDKGPAFQPVDLNYSVVGGDSTLHRLVLQKRDGSYFVALWVEQQGYDPDAHVDMPVDPQPIVFNTAATFPSVTVHQWDRQGAVTSTILPGGNSFSLVVTDKIMVLQLTPTVGTWKLNLSKSPATGGSILISPVSPNNTYTVGTTVTLTAVPAAGCSFSKITGAFPQSSFFQTVKPKSSMTEVFNFTCP